MGFPCTSCGACCRDVQIFDNYPALKGILAYKEDGSCVNLTEDNLCGIYDTRPEICRIPPGLSHRVLLGTAEECNRLQEQYGIGEEYRVIIDKPEDHPVTTASEDIESLEIFLMNATPKDQQRKEGQ